MLTAINYVSGPEIRKCTRIMPHLYLSCLVTSNQPAVLKNMGLVIRCRSNFEYDSEYVNRPNNSRRYMNDTGIKELVIIIGDRPSENIGKHFKNAISAIHSARKNGINVLVHCDMGISRSSTLVLAYEIWLCAHSNARNIPELSSFIASMKNKRSVIRPNYGFHKTLVNYRKSWINERNKITPTLDNLMQQVGRTISDKFRLVSS
jgi:protein-tyrosine phosphatase